MGEDSDHPTDSTPIPIFDQPSSSSQPKKDKPSKKVQRQKAEVPQDEAEHEESLPTPSNDPQASGDDSMKLTNLMEKISRPTGFKRLRKVGMSQRIESSEDQESLGVPEDASKHGRSIEDIDADVDVSLVDETQERQDDDLIFDTGVLDDVEMLVLAKVDGKDEQSTKKLNDSTAGEAVTTSLETPTTTDPRIKGGCSPRSQVVSEDIQAELDAALLEEQEAGKGNKKKKANHSIELSHENTQAKGYGSEVTRKVKKSNEEVEEEKESGEVEEDDEVELKKLLVIKKDEDIAIDAIKNKKLGSSLEDSEAKYGDTSQKMNLKSNCNGNLRVMFETQT
ncbi:hypothetical protein Tco_0749850 [Tanacetum coccineum]|uniref:Uncharacterized protein n=1 Tax=Tanacetum coccineum TaxID=301880 RepID=A0ABQ4YZP1_9ASTR